MRRWRDLLVVAIGATVVVAVLVIGGGSKSEQVAPTTTTTTTTIVATTTTLLPSLQLGTPSGVQLLVTSERGVVLVDLDSGDRTVVAPSHEASYSVLARGVVVQDGRGIEYLDDSLAEPGLPLGTSDVVVPSPRNDRFWLVGYGPSSATVKEVDTTGAVTGGPFEIPSIGVVSAVDDGLVGTIDGTMRLFNPDGETRQIGTGELLTAGGNVVLFRTCAAERCTLSIVDVRTNDVTVVEGYEMSGVLQNPPARISPDGRTAAIFDTVGGLEVRLVDLASGEIIATAPASGGYGPALIAWSRDGQWVFVSNGGPIQAIRSDGSDSRPVSIGELAPARSLAAI